MSEIYRTGLWSVLRVQRDAADALGLPAFRKWRRAVLPKAIPIALPGSIRNTSLILKGTSLFSIITVFELSSTAGSVASQTFQPMQILIPAAVIYLLLNRALTALQNLGERRWAVK